MKNYFKNLLLIPAALLTGCLLLTGCGTDEPEGTDSDGDKPADVNPGKPTDDPQNTITVNLLSGQTSSTSTSLGEGIYIYVDAAHNLCVDSYCGLIDLGAVAGLGNIVKIPNEGWKSKAAIIVGHGYIIKYQWSNHNPSYARLYVDDVLTSGSDNSMNASIVGYTVKYQCPMTTPILLETKSVTFDGEGGVQTVNLYSGTNISVQAKPQWCSVEVSGSNVVITAQANMANSQRKGTITLKNTEGTNDITVTQAGGEEIFAGGSGKKEDPYLISKPKHLDNVRLSPTSYFKQTADIDLTNYIDSNGNGWEPINDFLGTYDGNFKTISGLWINRPNSDDIGLFGTAYSATFQGIMLKLSPAGITGQTRVAGICGYYDGISAISRCSVEGNISGSDCISGIANVRSTQSSISECRVIGNITTTNYAYGISNSANVNNCYVVGDLISTKAYGRLYAFADNNSVYNSYIVGEHIGSNNCYGVNISKHCYGWGNVSDEAMMKKATYEGWDFKSIWSINEGRSYPTLRCFSR